MFKLRHIVLMAALVAVPVLPLAAEILEQVLVKVNGEIVTKTDLEERQVAYLRQQNQQYSDEELKAVIAQITPQILVDVVDEMLLVQRGRELGYRLDDQQFKEILDRIKKENRIEDEEQFQAALKQEGLTMEDLRRSLERQALVSRVQQIEVMRSISITDVELRQFYETHQDEFRTKPEVTLREILVDVPQDPRGINVAADDEARAKAETARARVMAGEDFARVAGELSDSPSRANGGLIGPVNRGELAPTVQAVLERLPRGQVSEVLRTPRGYQILKLESATEASVPPFEQLRDQVGDRVAEARHRAEMAKYVKRLREQAIIEWKNKELEKAYQERVEAQTASLP